jgi:hypothetical protein
MAQFIQSDQLAPTQGTIGNQGIVNKAPTPVGPSIESATNGLLGVADMAGDIYGEIKGKAIAKESVEELDAARAEAEKMRFTSGEDVPEGLNVDQNEWDMMARAVQTGSMSREDARLIASSRIRSKIAQQPLFADRIRRAASGVVGFNIESLGAQEYFSSFATEASLAKQRSDNASSAQGKMWDRAGALAGVGMFATQQEAYTMLVKEDGYKAQKSLAENELAIKGIDSQQFATRFNNANQVSAWGTTLGEVRAFEAIEGKPIDGVAFSRIIDERKQEAIEEFNAGWSKGDSPTGTPEYNRGLAVLTNQYAEMKDFVDVYGVDNLNKVSIQRSVQAREIYGDNFFSKMKTITQNMGQQVASDVLKLSSLSTSQRERMFTGNQPLRDAYELLGQDPDTFNRTLTNTGISLMEGGDLSTQDPVILDAAATELYNSGDKETQTAVVKGLFAGALNWKGTSLAASKSPRVSDQEVVKIYKRQYEEGVVPAVKQFTDQITSNPFLSWSVDTDGMLNVEQVQSAPDVNRTSFGGLAPDPREAQNRLLQGKRAQQTADKLNQFAKGHRNGWSAVVGESLDQYTNRLTTLVGEGVVDSDNTKTTAVNTEIDDIVTLMENNDLDFAKRRYEKLRDFYPFDVTASWEDVLEDLRGGN